ncbi:MAG: putative lipid II flippase FtsW [Pedosphaera sp.]|nr:putative lipid II flippase FtsW [Pedosphaera sp.]MST01338.1 putative lipid II flippase FtsW [Pedosphaera sp.]
MKWATTILVFCVAALLSLGLVMLYSASMAQQGSRYLVMQLIWGGLGLVACLFAASLDYRELKRYAFPALGLTLLLLLLVLIPGIGMMKNGARRWFDLRVMSFQPSELAKLSLILALAAYGERFQRQMTSFKRGLLLPGVFIAITLGLILKEPDFGTTALLASVSVVLLLLAGVRWLYVVPPALAGVIGIAILVMHDPVRMKRILAFLHPEEHRSGVGFQAYQAMLALGSGGWFGLGLGNGRQKLGFVPEHHTDFIFSIVGEELGLVATLGVVAAFVAFVICGLYIARRARDNFGLLLGSGITFLIGLQAFINIGVVTSALPNKGLPLPFISYGGSSLLMMLTCVGLLLSVARQAEETLPAEVELSGDGENPAPIIS